MAHLHNLQLGGGALGDGVVLAEGSQTTVASGSYPYRLFNGTVTNAGTFTWEGGYVTPNGGGINSFVNEGTVELNGADGTGFVQYFGSGEFVNQVGGVRRNEASGSATIGLPIDNQGTIPGRRYALSQCRRPLVGRIRPGRRRRARRVGQFHA